MTVSVVKLSVRERRVRWTRWEQSAEDDDASTQKGGEDERDFEPDLDTIAELVALQQLLTDSMAELERLPDGGAPRKDAEALRKKTRDELPRLVKLIGRHLYDALLAPDLQKSLEDLATTSPAGELLRVELDFLNRENQVDGKLASLPWEYLYSKRLGDFLAAKSDLVLNRKLLADDRERGATRGEPVTLLLVIARPRDCGTVLGDSVQQAIKGLVEAKKIGRLVELIEPVQTRRDPSYVATATFDRFRKLLAAERPQIVHFIGHGLRDAGGVKLAFVGEGGTADPIDAVAFARELSSTSGVRLAVIQACESALPDPHTPVSGIALQLAQKRIPAIVAMQARIENRHADDFSGAFYGALAEGLPVDRAVMRGRLAINLQAAEQPFGVPVLYLRSYRPILGKVRPPPPAGLRCPACDSPNGERAKFCASCGQRLSCPRCGTPIENPKANFCDDCGEPLRALDRVEQAPRAASAAPAAGAGTNVFGLRGGGG